MSRLRACFSCGHPQDRHVSDTIWPGCCRCRGFTVNHGAVPQRSPEDVDPEVRAAFAEARKLIEELKADAARRRTNRKPTP